MIQYTRTPKKVAKNGIKIAKTNVFSLRLLFGITEKMVVFDFIITIKNAS